MAAEAPTVVHVLATRPDAVTLAPVVAALERSGRFVQRVLLTGQHSVPAMVEDTLADLGLPAPVRNLQTGSGSHAQQSSRAMSAGMEALAGLRPALATITGASNSALGCALAAAMLDVPIVRLEAGQREHDWSVPEEINRVLLDTMADSLFATTEEAADNLRAERIGGGRVRVVGSTAVDSLRRAEPAARADAVWRRYGLTRGAYVLVTLHRPANVDEDEQLARIVTELAALASRVPVIFPVHPRTMQRLAPMGDAGRLAEAGIVLAPPLRYREFVSLQVGAGAVVTDSATVQEEASAIGVRCFTLRASTDRIATLTHGTNVLLGDDPRELAVVRPAAAEPQACVIPLWDGRAGERVAEALVRTYAVKRISGAG